MEIAYEVEKRLFLDELMTLGTVKIHWYKIYRWYGLERMSKAAYKNFHQLILDNYIAREDGKEPEIRYLNHGTYLTIFINDMAQDISEMYA